MDGDETAVIFAKKRRRKKISGLIFLSGLTAVVLIVETYAWFVGLSIASVNAFSVSVSSGEGLELSLDGVSWYKGNSNLTISQTSITTGAYTGNTNKWVSEKGLIPVSSSGKIDKNVGRLILYGKSSLTATQGGYRLISSRINNYGSESNGQLVSEDDGYVVFDLFIRNGTGSNYTHDYNSSDDESVYLSTSSSVKVASAGNTTEDYGLANSVRLAFLQIGRVSASTASSGEIQSINCTTTIVNTSLCDNVSPVIWEPNETSHNTKLITYFSTVCKKKNSSGYTAESCDSLNNGSYIQTYTVAGDITSADQIDVYDGINGTTPSNTKLSSTNTFTDTMKNKANSGEALEFFKLAANSVTKIRVYIYLEGQDVDNYDLISNDLAISVSFGFTKDRYGLTNS
jgi:hypothetical protein